MVGQVDRAGAVGPRLIADFQAIIGGEAVVDLHVEVTGKPLVAVWRMQRVTHLLFILLNNPPAAGVEAFRPAV
ncbi:hypothetical protein D3C75_942890 [compost metagenome]